MPEKIKFCLKCLHHPVGSEWEFCPSCGSKLVDWDLKCGCGEPIYPSFFPRFFPPWGQKISLKHCPHCGAKVDNLIIEEVKRLINLK